VNPKHLATLELNKVLDHLAAHAAFSASRELLLELQPATDPRVVRERLAETTEARRLLSSRPAMTIGGARDVRGAAQRAALGARLSAPDLLEIAGTLESAAVLRDVLTDHEVYPGLAGHGADMTPLPTLVREIADVIDINGDVLDSASPRLAELRVRVRGGRDRVLRRLEAIIADPDTAEAIQQPIVTERAGRYVLAVKAGFRQRIRGIVHDQSESGATLFLEPLAVVDLTNDWRQAQLDEQREVDRLLRELSARVGEQVAALERTVLAIARFDAALARAHYAEALEAVEPAVDEGGQLDLLAARHPLLTGRVVPQTIRLGGAFTILVITGPNTGGKTVALKTAGLLALMAQCGLHIPAGPGSRVAVYQEVLADIGDEQSIEQSLSTFSGHMRTLVHILSVASDRTLVLLDELGAGTDPTEGSALARVILDELLRRGTPTIATTHFSELKTFAHDRPGVENASVEFDINTLSPTYRLLIGTPGRSNALAIAAKLGLDAALLDAARASLTSEHLRVEALLEGITQKQRAAARDRNRAGREERDLRQLRAQARESLEEAERIRQAAREQAYAEAEEEVADLRRQTARLAQQLERLHRPEAHPARELHAEIALVGQRLSAARPRPAMAAVPVRQVNAGQMVRVAGFAQPGQVVAGPDARGEVEVQIGAFHARVPLAELSPVASQRSGERGFTFTAAPSRPKRSHTLEAPLDLRGLRADEVRPLLERELDEAFTAGVQYLRIVHGHGTGVIRRIVREFLESQPYVSSYEPASPTQGGDGATLVTLALR